MPIETYEVSLESARGLVFGFIGAVEQLAEELKIKVEAINHHSDKSDKILNEISSIVQNINNVLKLEKILAETEHQSGKLSLFFTNNIVRILRDRINKIQQEHFTLEGNN